MKTHAPAPLVLIKINRKILFSGGMTRRKKNKLEINLLSERNKNSQFPTRGTTYFPCCQDLDSLRLCDCEVFGCPWGSTYMHCCDPHVDQSVDYHENW